MTLSDMLQSLNNNWRVYPAPQAQPINVNININDVHPFRGHHPHFGGIPHHAHTPASRPDPKPSDSAGTGNTGTTAPSKPVITVPTGGNQVSAPPAATTGQPAISVPTGGNQASAPTGYDQHGNGTHHQPHNHGHHINVHC